MFRNISLVSRILVLFLVVVFSSFTNYSTQISPSDPNYFASSKSHVLELWGYMFDKNKVILKDVQIKLFQISNHHSRLVNGELNKSYEPKFDSLGTFMCGKVSGKFVFWVDFDSEYFIEVQRAGYVTRGVNVSTYFSGTKPELMNHGFSLDMVKEEKNASNHRNKYLRADNYNPRTGRFNTTITLQGQGGTRSQNEAEESVVSTRPLPAIEENEFAAEQLMEVPTHKHVGSGISLNDFKLGVDEKGTYKESEDGDIINRINYDNGRQGVWLYSDSNNTANSVMGKYDHDAKEGYWLKVQNDVLKAKLMFKKDTFASGFEVLHENGKIRQEGYFDLQAEKYSDKLKSYYEDGAVRSILSYGKNGSMEGFQQVFHQNGNLAMTFAMKQDKLNGSMVQYSEGGAPVFEQIYEGGTMVSEHAYGDLAGVFGQQYFDDFVQEMELEKLNTTQVVRATLAEIEGNELNYEALLRQREAELVTANLLVKKTEMENASLAELLTKQQLEEELLTAKNRSKSILIGVFSLALLFVFVLLYSMKRKNKTITLQKQEIEIQKKSVEEIHYEMIDSITYAKRLQEAILPPIAMFGEALPDSFVLFKPKDIVSGDFYWMETSDRKIIIAAADCTGHGVPGAMVSVVCANALNRAVKEFGLLDPGAILDKTRELLVATFERSDREVRDGMDISLCVLDRNTLKASWAGANNPLWVIRDGEFLEYKANRQPIGKHAENSSFDTHVLEVLPGDNLYMFSDGFQDQFGGPRNKKYKVKNLKDFLTTICDKAPKLQSELLLAEFERWRGNFEQTDDICVIGIRA